uniref:CASAMP N-terminal domain-containing protein n=1 Tax=Eptatretus burgeri TaxID=7764 RepID=A0A8C4PWW4_EPTBU
MYLIFPSPPKVAMASRPGRYDNVTAKVVGNIRWALAKSGYSPDIVSDLWEPWENEMESEGCGETGTVVGDDFHGQHLKTDIVQLLTSGELYTRICSRLGLPTQHRGAGSGGPIRWGQVMGESSRAHWAVISALSRRRFYPSEGPDYPITASDLTQTPIRTWSHMALMDTLMEFNCQSLCPTRLSISAASRLSPTPRAPMPPHNPSWEAALLHWVNMVVCKAYKDRDAEPPSVQSIEDLSDGRALLAVIEHYTKPLDRHSGSSVSECLCLLEDTAQSLIGRTWHLTRADWLLSSNRLKVNMLTCVAEIFHALDGEKEEQEKEQEKQEKEKESDSSPPHTNSSSPLSGYHDDVTDPDKSLESENEVVRVAKHNGQEDISSQLSWSSEVMGSSRKVTAGNRITRDNPVVSPGMACKTGNDATEVTNGLHDDEFSAAVTRLNTEVLKRQKELDELVITATVLGQKDGVDLSQNLEILNNRAREVGTEVTRLLKKQKEVMEMWGTGLEQGRGHGRGQGRVPARLLRRMGRGREPQNLKATHGRQAVLSVSTPDLRTGAGESLMKPTVSSLQRSRLRPAKSSGNLLLPELRMPVKSSSQSRLHLGRDSKLTDARSRRSNSPAKTLHRRGRAGDGAERRWE